MLWHRSGSPFLSASDVQRNRCATPVQTLRNRLFDDDACVGVVTGFHNGRVPSPTETLARCTSCVRCSLCAARQCSCAVLMFCLFFPGKSFETEVEPPRSIWGHPGFINGPKLRRYKCSCCLVRVDSVALRMTLHLLLFCVCLFCPHRGDHLSVGKRTISRLAWCADKFEEGRLPNQVTRSSSVYKFCREKQPYILIFSFRYLFWSVSLRRVFSITLAFTPTELFLLAYFSRSYSLLRLFSNLFRYTRRQEQ